MTRDVMRKKQPPAFRSLVSGGLNRGPHGKGLDYCSLACITSTGFSAPPGRWNAVVSCGRHVCDVESGLRNNARQLKLQLERFGLYVTTTKPPRS